jgi:hypothetical protein
VLAQDVHQMKIHGAICRPAWDENQWSAGTGLPIAEVDIVTGGKAAHFKPIKIRNLAGLTDDFVWEVEVLAKQGKERLVVQWVIQDKAPAGVEFIDER